MLVKPRNPLSRLLPTGIFPAMPIGHISWTDLTVENTEEVRDFYAAVVGWTPQDEGMEHYNDYSMLASDGTVVAGVCHRKGVNADLPPQ